MFSTITPTINARGQSGLSWSVPIFCPVHILKLFRAVTAGSGAAQLGTQYVR